MSSSIPTNSESNCPCGSLNGLLYVVGLMQEDEDAFKTYCGPTYSPVECYNPETNNWTPVTENKMDWDQEDLEDHPRQTYPRASPGVFGHNGLLYVMGGAYGAGYSNVEIFDPETGKESGPCCPQQK